MKSAGWQPALVWSAPPLQGGGDAGKQVQLHTCIRPLEWKPWFPGPDGIRARLASSPRRPRMGLGRAQACGLPVRPVLPSTSRLPRTCWRPRCRLESLPSLPLPRSPARSLAARGTRVHAVAAPTRCGRSCLPTPPRRCSPRAARAPPPPSGCADPPALAPPATPRAP